MANSQEFHQEEQRLFKAFEDARREWLAGANRTKGSMEEALQVYSAFIERSIHLAQRLSQLNEQQS
jgi:hypothetical protein